MDNIFLIYGLEKFVIDRQVETIIKKTIGESMEYNTIKYDLQQTPIQEVIEDCETIPFLSEYKVIIVENPYFLTGKKVKVDFEHDLEGFLSYINNPSNTTILIIVADYEKIDTRKKIVKTLYKKAHVYEASKLDDNKLFDNIRKIVEKKNKRISDDAIKELIKRIGNNFSILYQEIKKIIIYKNDSDEITIDDVKLLSSRTLEDNIFELVDSVINKDSEKSLRIYYDLLRQNEEPIRIIIIIAGQFRLLYQTKKLYQKGYSEKEIASKLKVHPYRVKLAGRKISKYNETELLKYLDELSTLDQTIKSGKVEKKLGLELFFLKLGEA